MILKFIFSIFCYISLPLWAKIYDVTEISERSRIEYNDTMIHLEYGDELLFSNGKRYVVERVLNYEDGILKNGYNSIIIKIKDSNRVLRIPRFSDLASQNFLNSYFSAYDLLVQGGLRVPIIYDYLQSIYIETEYIDLKFRGEEFFKYYRNKMTKSEIARIEKSFVEFFKKGKQVIAVGDFHLGQMVWNSKEWVLLDWELKGTSDKVDWSKISLIERLQNELSKLENPSYIKLLKKVLSALKAELKDIDYKKYDFYCSSLFKDI